MWITVLFRGLSLRKAAKREVFTDIMVQENMVQENRGVEYVTYLYFGKLLLVLCRGSAFL